MARLFRDLRVLGWSVPRTRSQSASAPRYIGIASAIRPFRVFAWRAPGPHSNSGRIVSNEPPTLCPAKRSRRGESNNASPPDRTRSTKDPTTRDYTCPASKWANASPILPGGRTRRPVSRRPVPLRVRGLTHFDQITVGIPDVATGLVRVPFRRRQELSTAGAPFRVHGLDVLDPEVEEAADPVRVARRLQGDRRLVVGRTSAGIDDDPGVG